MAAQVGFWGGADDDCIDPPFFDCGRVLFGSRIAKREADFLIEDGLYSVTALRENDQPKGVGLPGITQKRVGFPLKILE